MTLCLCGGGGLDVWVRSESVSLKIEKPKYLECKVILLVHSFYRTLSSPLTLAVANLVLLNFVLLLFSVF